MTQPHDEPQPAASARPTPASVDVSDAAITIVWKDGHHSVYPHRYLRLRCHCATCVGEGMGRHSIDPVHGPRGRSRARVHARGPLRPPVPLERRPLHRHLPLRRPPRVLPLLRVRCDYRIASHPAFFASHIASGSLSQSFIADYVSKPN